jgi:hypothetical protein
MDTFQTCIGPLIKPGYVYGGIRSGKPADHLQLAAVSACNQQFFVCKHSLTPP